MREGDVLLTPEWVVPELICVLVKVEGGEGFLDFNFENNMNKRNTFSGSMREWYPFELYAFSLDVLECFRKIGG